MIKKLILKILMRFMTTTSDISASCNKEISNVLKDKKKLKKHANFLFAVIDYNIRHKGSTGIQLQALRRINGK